MGRFLNWRIAYGLSTRKTRPELCRNCMCIAERQFPLLQWWQVYGHARLRVALWCAVFGSCIESPADFKKYMKFKKAVSSWKAEGYWPVFWWTQSLSFFFLCQVPLAVTWLFRPLFIIWNSWYTWAELYWQLYYFFAGGGSVCCLLVHVCLTHGSFKRAIPSERRPT